ncbi:MAG: hypothetical protein EBT13_17590, partial [Rhodobacteraceae bacterium]|nr:hypothetical protein [Paracoccaceae bacterium]
RLMPTYIVTAPDGKKYRVTAPEGATREEVMARVQNTAPKASKEKPTSFWQGFGESFGNAGANAMQYMAKINPITNIIDSGAKALGYEEPFAAPAKASRKAIKTASARSPYQGSTAGKIVGGIVGSAPSMFIPGGPVVQGAAGGALLTENPDNPVTLLRDVVVGGAAGKVGDVVGRKIVAPAAKGLVNAAKKVAGSNMDEVAAAAAAEANPLAALGDDAIARAERFQRVGVQNPTTGMVTRDPRVWNLEQEGLKRMGAGDDILRQIQSVDDDLRAAGERLMGGFSGDTAEETGKAVQNVLTQKDKELGQAVSRLYTNIRAERGDVPVGGLQAFRDMLDSPDVVDNAVFDGMRTSVLRRLERLGGNTTIGQAEDIARRILQ